jgi:serine/threonine protein kinase
MQTPIASGTLLQNRYYLLRMGRLAEFGWLYSAVDQQHQGRLCLLEEFIPPWQSGANLEQVRQAFATQVSTIAVGSHDQIPQYQGAIADQGRIFLPQDYHEGKTYRQFLEERIFQGRRFSATEALTQWQGLLTTLSELHSHGLIHGNLSLDSLSTPTWNHPPRLMHLGQIRQLALDLGFQPCQAIAPAPRLTETADLQAVAQIILQLLTGQDLTHLYDRTTRSWIWQRDRLPSHCADLLDGLLCLSPKNQNISAQQVLQAIRGEIRLQIDPSPAHIPAPTHPGISDRPPTSQEHRQVAHPPSAIALEPIALPSRSAIPAMFADLTQQTAQILRPELPPFPSIPSASNSIYELPTDTLPTHERQSYERPETSTEPYHYHHDRHNHRNTNHNLDHHTSSNAKPTRKIPFWQDFSFLPIGILLLLFSGLALARLGRTFRPISPVITLPSANPPIADSLNPSQKSSQKSPSLSNPDSRSATSTTVLSQQIQTQLQTLNIPTPIFVGTVDELTHDRLSNPSSDRAAIEQRWNHNAVTLIKKLETLDLQARQGMGTYRRTSYDRWLATAQTSLQTATQTPTHPLHPATANWITDQKFFTWFPEQKGRQLNPRQLGQVWYAIAQQQLAHLPDHTFTLPKAFQPFGHSANLTESGFKLYRVERKPGQQLQIEFKATQGNSHFTILHRDRVLIQNSQDKQWKTAITQAGNYEIVITGDRNSQFQLRILP